MSKSMNRHKQIEIQNLKVSYGAVQALKGVSLEVTSGEIVALVGSNGAGKTTLLKSISGLIPIQSGKIIFTHLGKEHLLNKLPAHKIVSLGIAQSPEGRQVFSNLTVKENLELGAYSRKDKVHFKEEFEKIFILFPRLKERLKQLAGTLSGGEQQMLAISRALMSKPALLLLDEPSLGIAPALTEQIFETLLKINEEGLSILLIEQDASLALEISSRAYVLENGLIKLEGNSSELIENPEVQKAYLGGE